MKIRNAVMGELNLLMEMYADARRFMAEHGNPDQWGTSYPPREMVEGDIRGENVYVCEEDGRVTGAFYYKEGKDATYEVIEDGTWLSKRPYGVVHRIISDGTVKGTASFCLAWALEQCKNLKIDTHRENRVMQKLLEKNGFTYCGIIYAEDGSRRMAYQKQAK